MNSDIPVPASSRSHATEIAQELLEFVRTATGSRSVGLSEPLQRLSGGFDTEVFAFRLENPPLELSGPLVLRLHRTPNDSRKARIETAVHTAASAGGHPVPAVPIDANGYYILGRPFLVMKRAPGVPLITAMSNPAVLKSVPRLLAGVQSRLHSLSPAGLITTLKLRDIDPASLTPFRLLGDIHRLSAAAKLRDLQPLVDWLDEHRPGQPAEPCICHGDFHPGNILVEDGRVTGVIDWANVALGHPEFDVAITGMIISIGPVEGWDQLSRANPRRMEAAVAAYLAAYREHRDLDDELLGYYTALRAARAFFKIAAAAVAPEVPGVAHDQYAWRHPTILRVITGAIRRVTGITVSPSESASDNETSRS